MKQNYCMLALASPEQFSWDRSCLYFGNFEGSRRIPETGTGLLSKFTDETLHQSLVAVRSEPAVRGDGGIVGVHHPDFWELI